MRVAIAIAATLVVIATGLWLTQSGRPYGTAALTVHKLVALGVAAAVGVAAWRLHRADPLSAGTWVALAATAVLTLATFGSGGIASGMQQPPTAVVWAHRVGSWVAAIALAARALMAMGR